MRNAEDLLKLHQRIVERLEQVEGELSWKAEGYSNQQALFKVAAGRVARIFLDEVSLLAVDGMLRWTLMSRW